MQKAETHRINMWPEIARWMVESGHRKCCMYGVIEEGGGDLEPFLLTVARNFGKQAFKSKFIEKLPFKNGTYSTSRTDQFAVLTFGKEKELGALGQRFAFSIFTPHEGLDETTPVFSLLYQRSKNTAVIVGNSRTFASFLDEAKRKAEEEGRRVLRNMGVLFSDGHGVRETSVDRLLSCLPRVRNWTTIQSVMAEKGYGKARIFFPLWEGKIDGKVIIPSLIRGLENPESLNDLWRNEPIGGDGAFEPQDGRNCFLVFMSEAARKKGRAECAVFTISSDGQRFADSRVVLFSYEKKGSIMRLKNRETPPVEDFLAQTDAELTNAGRSAFKEATLKKLDLG